MNEHFPSHLVILSPTGLWLQLSISVCVTVDLINIPTRQAYSMTYKYPDGLRAGQISNEMHLQVTQFWVYAPICCFKWENTEYLDIEHSWYMSISAW